jgi:hypothetical protein
MPESYYREATFPSASELWLDAAAKHGMVITCNCKRCRRLVRYLAADLLPIIGPAHRAMVDPPFPCGKCSRKDAITVKCEVPDMADYGHIEVRRPAGIAQRQLWRTVKLGDEVANKLEPLPDLSDWTDTFRRHRKGQPLKQRGE